MSKDSERRGPLALSSKPSFDVVVVGAGVFGAWTANFLQRTGRRVLLLDAYGSSNSRASSGGETRIIRMGYGPDELYTRWSMRSLTLWQEFFARTSLPLFHRTGMLWIARESDRYAHDTIAVLKKCGVLFEQISRRDLERRYPQVRFQSDEFGFLELNSGVLMARRSVDVVVADAVNHGAEFRTASVEAPADNRKLNAVRARSGATYAAGEFVFACGPWLPSLFPALLGERIFPTRQEVFFFGVPPGETKFSPPELPTWIDLPNETYGMPSLETRGIKVASDHHGPRVNPDVMERLASAEATSAARDYLARRFPALTGAPIVETRVCQYENTSNGDFLIDRHPDFENVWIAGGGSGHGFKHGPAFGEYVAESLRIGRNSEPRFSLSTKQTIQKRTVR